MEKTLKNNIPPLFGNDYKNKPKVHFIGIGGIGLSSLAQWFLAQNWLVYGSDAVKNENTQLLSKLGAKIKIGHKSKNISSKYNLIIYSQAIKLNNPEIIQAKKYNLLLKSYPEFVGYLTNLYKTIAISGAHGKSTTTALAALLFTNYDLDPTVIIGTKLKEFKNTNFRNGKGRYLILEADEYGGAFWNYSPFYAIITNIDNEHLDFYKNLNEIKKSFLKFISNIKFGGILILNKDDKNLFSLKNEILKITKNKNVNILWYSLKDKETQKIKKILKISGNHNLLNALAVFKLGKVLNIPETQILHSISRYEGAWRRMEYKNKFKIQISKFKTNINILVYDDYAHHPTEIKKTLEAFRQKYPLSPLICVFEPHQAQRLKVLFFEFKKSFNLADIVFILPIYQVRGRDSKINEKFSPKNLTKSVLKNHPTKFIFYLKNYKEINKKLNEVLNNKEILKILEKKYFIKNKNNEIILIMMGAGDIYKYTPKLIK
jgi:UDP-N-acetylmuramate--alanine ligase